MLKKYKNFTIKEILDESQTKNKPITVYWFEDAKTVVVRVGINIRFLSPFQTQGFAKKLAMFLEVEEYVRHRTMISYLRVDGEKKGYNNVGKNVAEEIKIQTAMTKLTWKEVKNALEEEGINV
jgi:response regulator of citrate/malate metabolism